jgi:hypothetical protein
MRTSPPCSSRCGWDAKTTTDKSGRGSGDFEVCRLKAATLCGTVPTFGQFSSETNGRLMMRVKAQGV